MARKRIEYIDTLKFLAIFGIIFIHISALWPNSQILSYDIREFSQIFRWGVPIFLMISGTLLLNRDIDLKIFFKKRFTRVFYPLVFFIILLDLVQGRFKFLSAYWYCWMILGVYLAVPIINKFIQHAEDSEIKYYVIIFLISSFIFQVAFMFNIRFALDINFFITPVSYLVLGYYLSTREYKLSSRNVILICLLVFIVITMVKYNTGNFMDFYAHGKFSTRLDIGIIQIIQACSVFIAVKEIYSSKAKGIVLWIQKFLQIDTIKRFILSVSRASYGMYLVHFLYREFLTPYAKSLTLTGTQVVLAEIGITVALFIISWLTVVLMSKIPLIDKVSGYG